MRFVESRIESIVLSVHKRNDGMMLKLDFDLRLLDSKLGLDSLDLAEIVVVIEKEFEVSPFDFSPPPRTWLDMVQICET